MRPVGRPLGARDTRGERMQHYLDWIVGHALPTWGTRGFDPAAGFATMTLVAARPVAGLDELASTGLGFTLGAVALAPLAVAGGLTFTATPASIGLLLFLGVGPTALGYAAYFRGLRTTAAGTAALMALLEPLVGTALAVLILGERLGVAGWCGAALLIVALAAESRLSSTR